MAIIRAPKKSKWYVVWIGHAPGIYPSWDKCRSQVEGFPGAKFRAYDTLSEARDAFAAGPPRIGGHKQAEAKEAQSATPSTTDAAPAKSARAKKSTTVAAKKPAKRGPITPSVSVDAACNMTTRVMEYRGVDTETGEELFRLGPFNDSTNNMGEFLAIVHALSLLSKQGKSVPVYSDSTTAITWVRNKLAKTTVAPSKGNKKVFQLIARAEEWLKTNTAPSRVLKWETDKWGENPADFGRK